ncbi:MAG TPA: hypothetical protein VHO70_20655 [Chitinispirillaceae bacterium]|nr:hypothetical protein [Chitinispirillaceae bacterium]
MSFIIPLLISLAPLISALGFGPLILHFISRKYAIPENDATIQLLNDACEKRVPLLMQAYFKKLTGCNPPPPDAIQFIFNSKEPFNGMRWFAKGGVYCKWHTKGFSLQSKNKVLFWKIFSNFWLAIGFLILLLPAGYSIIHRFKDFKESIIFLTLFSINFLCSLLIIKNAVGKLEEIWSAEKLCRIEMTKSDEELQ